MADTPFLIYITPLNALSGFHNAEFHHLGYYYKKESLVRVHYKLRGVSMLMDANIQKYKVFIKIAELGSYFREAEKLFLSVW
ncbi:TPA: hypothetical protein MI579_28760 [Klebsiella pneumoniae]|nr:hypothetical protein [Klebsiella pneumoniae]